ncbi:ATP-binding cassette domain-containing protein, partial [Mycobacterium tuberculosis]|nr:ATP-binding cassette domain-containing protein [Mycobacterium tuberculosis]
MGAAAEGPTGSGPSPLAAENLDLAYDQRQIVTDLDVQIPAGQFTVIVGPNACGKSTLLRALARLLPPAKGTVLLDGNDISRMKTNKGAEPTEMFTLWLVASDRITYEAAVARG